MRRINPRVTDQSPEAKLVWQARQWVMFSAKTIEAEGADLWRDLIESVKRATFDKCKLLLEAFWEDSPIQFHVHEPHTPSFDLTVRLELEMHQIRYVTERRAGRKEPPSVVERRLDIHLDDAGELYFKRGEEILGVDRAALLLLEPLLKKTS